MAKEILSAQHARDELEKNNRLEEKIKKFIIPSLITSVLFLVGFYGFQHIESKFVSVYICGFMFVGALLANIVMFVVAVIFGGKAMLKLIGSTIFIGFILLRLPYSIFLGFFICLFAVYYGIQAPILIFILALIKIKRENKKYNEYLQYCPEDINPAEEVNE